MTSEPIISSTREEMIRRYPDVMVGMGSAKQLGQVGPDEQGSLQKVSIKVNGQWTGMIILFIKKSFHDVISSVFHCKGFHSKSHAHS